MMSGLAFFSIRRRFGGTRKRKKPQAFLPENRSFQRLERHPLYSSGALRLKRAISRRDVVMAVT
jgi:hypothetical protein